MINTVKIIDFNIDEVLAIANVPRRILGKRANLTFKTYTSIKELDNIP